MKNHFELFGLAPAYALDLAHLDRAYRDIQAEVHPDRFAHAGDAERRASMQMTTQVNEAYRTLKSPVQRAKYLLEMNGVDVRFEINTAMPTDFLAEQMELREALENAREMKDPVALDAMRADLASSNRILELEVGEKIDKLSDYTGAANVVCRMQFLTRLAEEINSAYEFE